MIIEGIFRTIEGIFSRNKTMAVNKLAGLPLKYLIGSEGPWSGEAGTITELPYGAPMQTSGKPGEWIFYVNLFDETNSGNYGPYLHDSDTASEYNEGQIDPEGPGWKKNLIDQFKNVRAHDGQYVELDNPDAYDTADVIGAVDLAEEYALKVIAKNPNICEPDPAAYVGHPNVYGIIVEKGAGNPVTVNALRVRAKKPELPVWFVYFGGNRTVAEGVARVIQQNGMKNMGVSYSAKKEYGSSEDILLPIKVTA